MNHSVERPTRPWERAAYRVFLLDGDDGVRTSLPLTAADDVEALALARAMVDGHSVELWDGVRFIERFDRPRLV